MARESTGIDGCIDRAVHPRGVASPKTVTRLVYAAFLALASAFIVSSTAQVAWALFATPAAAGPPTGEACAVAVRDLAQAVDRALVAGTGAREPAEAERRYAEARRPEWDRREDALRACAGDPAGLDAVAALARLDRAAAEAVRRQSAELAPVRREVDSFIR